MLKLGRRCCCLGVRGREVPWGSSVDEFAGASFDGRAYLGQDSTFSR